MNDRRIEKSFNRVLTILFVSSVVLAGTSMWALRAKPLVDLCGVRCNDADQCTAGGDDNPCEDCEATPPLVLKTCQ
jgi:hypothetical protein